MDKVDVEKAADLINNPLWRINNLYNVIDKSGCKTLFKLNWAQELLYKNMWYCNIILKARQLGISTFIGLLFLDRTLFNSNVAAGIIAHTKEDSEVFFKRLKFAYDALPNWLKESRAANTDTANELVFSNGSSIRVGMLSRGQTLQYLHISEFGKISAKTPDKSREIITGSLNALAPGQHCFIESTAEGREGHFFEMCKRAQDLKDSKKPLSKLDFRFHFYNWMGNQEYRLDPSGITISKELNEYFDSIETKNRCTIDQEQRSWYSKKLESQKDDMKREYPSLPEEAFESAADGNFYSKYLTKARQENRITSIFWDPKRPVYSAWDLGYRDPSAIWLFQVDGQRINVLEFYESSGEALTHYIAWLKAKPYTFGGHFVPHDSSQTEFGSGLTRTEIARGLGVEFSQIKSILIEEGIDCVRNNFHRFFFDESRCEKGIKALDSYRREWNDRLGAWSKQPRHDWSSHGSDALRVLAIGLSEIESRQNASSEDDQKALNRYFSR